MVKNRMQWWGMALNMARLLFLLPHSNGNQPPAYSTDDPLRVPSASGTQQGQGPTVAHTASTPQSQTSTPQSQTTTQQGQANSVASLLQAHCPPTVSEASRASDVPTISCVAAPGMAGATASPGSIDLGVPTETIAWWLNSLSVPNKALVGAWIFSWPCS